MEDRPDFERYLSTINAKLANIAFDKWHKQLSEKKLIEIANAAHTMCAVNAVEIGSGKLAWAKELAMLVKKPWWRK